MTTTDQIAAVLRERLPFLAEKMIAAGLAIRWKQSTGEFETEIARTLAEAVASIPGLCIAKQAEPDSPLACDPDEAERKKEGLKFIESRFID